MMTIIITGARARCLLVPTAIVIITSTTTGLHHPPTADHQPPTCSYSKGSELILYVSARPKA